MPISDSVVLQPHQERVRAAALHAVRTGTPLRQLLLHDPGSGKSLAGLAAAETLGEPYTVVTPASLRQNYRDQLDRFTTDPQPHQVLSYTQLARGRPVEHPGTVIFDEAQRLASPTALQARAGRDLALKARHALFLTGTPVANHARDILPLLEALTKTPVAPDTLAAALEPPQRTLLSRLGLTRTPAERARERVKSLLRGKVDVHAVPPSDVPVTHEQVVTEHSPAQARLYQAMYGRLPWLLRQKLRFDYPLSGAELRAARSFLSGPRMVGLSDLPFRGDRDPYESFLSSGKLRAAHANLTDELAGDPRRKAVVYSNFVQAGLEPYAAALARDGVPHGFYHGGLSPAVRRRAVDDFNAGRTRVLFLGPAGAEGLSLKGAQLVQLLDKHWHDARLQQAAARVLRFDAHAGLPEELRRVRVQHYVSRVPPGPWGRLLRRLGVRGEAERATDDQLAALAHRKTDELLPLLQLLHEVGRPVTHAHAPATQPPAPGRDDGGAEGVGAPGARLRPGLGHGLPGGGPGKSGAVVAAHQPAAAGAQRHLRPPGAGRAGDEYDIACPDCHQLLPYCRCPAGGGLTSFLRDVAKTAAVAVGIPDRAAYGDHTRLTPGRFYDLVGQTHDARRAGRHTDVRLGSPELGLLSWAARKGFPAPGEKHLALRQPDHAFSYADFQGEIPEGYGAGRVTTERRGRVLVTDVTPDAVRFTTADTRYPERFILRRTGGKNWLLMNVTQDRSEVVRHTKQHYAKVPAERAEAVLDGLQPGSSVQAKLDGAASLTKLYRDHAEVVSYRAAGPNTPKGLAGAPLVHTERVTGGRLPLRVPRDLVGTVLRGELYGVHAPTGRAVAPQELGGLLNAGVEKSRAAQAERQVNLRQMLFDVEQLGGAAVPKTTPYAERLALLRRVLPHLPAGTFHGPEEATTPAAARALWDRVRTGNEPLTREGLVVHPPTGKPSKIKLLEEADVYPTGIFPGAGKYTGVGAGGFTYALTPGGPTVGRVGTGFTDATRRQLWADPSALLGQPTRVRYQNRFPSGALRAPAYLGPHLDYPLAKAASVKRLRQAKAESDRGNYAAKTRILRGLIREAPADWRVDSKLRGNHIYGLTHTPTGFRFHLPASQVRDLLPH